MINKTTYLQRVLVTRPLGQQHIITSLEQHGFEPIAMPLIRIVPKPHALQQAPNQYDLIIFTSANAVCHAEFQVPTEPTLMAVGPATAQHLPKRTIIADKPYNSECLLAHPHCQHVQGKRILLVKGEGGRELLAQTLQQRGAFVEACDVYQRQLIEYPDGELATLRYDVAIATSQQIIQRYYDLFVAQHADKHRLLIPLLVIGERQQSFAQQLGFGAIEVAQSASDDAILTRITAWREQE